MKRGEKLTIVKGATGYVVFEGVSDEEKARLKAEGKPFPTVDHHFETAAGASLFVIHRMEVESTEDDPERTPGPQPVGEVDEDGRPGEAAA